MEPDATKRVAFLRSIVEALPSVRAFFPPLRLTTTVSELALALCPDSPEGQALAGPLFEEAAALVSVFDRRKTGYADVLRKLASAPPKTLEEAAAADKACADAAGL